MSLFFLGLALAAAILFAIAYRLPRPWAAYAAFFGLGTVAVAVVTAFIDGDEGGPILLAGGVGLVVLHRWAQRDRRRRAMARFAWEHGFDFRAKYAEGLSGDFRLFGRGDGREARNALGGIWQGVPVKTLDYGYFETKAAWGFYRVKRWRRFSVGILDLGASVPSVITELNGAAGLSSDYMGFHDIQLESDDFNRRFHVTCDDREFAYKFFDGQMLRWILGQPELLETEVLGRRGLVAMPRLEPERMGTLLDAAVGFYTHLPSVARQKSQASEPIVP
ncbi:MAG: hypothetical protein ACRDHO_01490 [Actinomycetota bacterium]